jgi:hypothetical protein
MDKVKRMLGGLVVAIVLAFVLAWADARLKADEGDVLIPRPPMTEEEKQFKEWCSTLPNWQYLINPGCWQYF